MIPRLVADPQRVDERDVHVRPVERQVVVAPVPQQHIALRLGLFEDRRVVDAGVDHGPRRDVGLVLLPLLDRAVIPVEILELREPLHALRDEVPVRHRMPDGHDLLPGLLERRGHGPGRLGLPDAGADRGDGHRRDRGLEHRGVRPEQLEVRARGEHLARPVHHVLVRDVGVREDHVVHVQVDDQPPELVLLVDRDAAGVAVPREDGGVRSVIDVGDLGRGERDDVGLGVVPVDDVEVVEVAAGGSHDQDTTQHGVRSFQERVV